MMAKANKIVMTAAGLVLITATILKSHQLLTEPIISEGFWESWEFFLIQIPLELGLGIWLVSGLFRKAGWLLGVMAFGMFIGVTLQKAITGAESCGCFGVVHVNPWITFSTIDIPFFVLLLLFRPKGYKLFPPPWPSARHFFGVAMPTFIIIAALMPTLIFNKPPEKTDTYEVIKPEDWITQHAATSESSSSEPTTDNSTIIQQTIIENQLEQKQPEQKEMIDTGMETIQKLAADQWPMLQHIDIADSLRKGIVVVMFYRHDCPNCHEAIPIYDEFSRDMAGNEDSLKFAFIEVPPYGPKDENPIPADTPSLTGRLDESKKWYITTPLTVMILEGEVVKTWQVEIPTLDELLNSVFSEG